MIPDKIFEDLLTNIRWGKITKDDYNELEPYLVFDSKKEYTVRNFNQEKKKRIIIFFYM